MTERFDVVVYDIAGFWTYAARDLDAKAAVDRAKHLVDMADDRNEGIDRVLITDSDDFTTFLWERGKGVVYPPLKESAA
jgi:hypothetical protein